jgi:hypothetical protein
VCFRLHTHWDDLVVLLEHDVEQGHDCLPPELCFHRCEWHNRGCERCQSRSVRNDELRHRIYKVWGYLKELR